MGSRNPSAALALAALLCGGCAPRPPQPAETIERSRAFPVARSEAWERLLDFVALEGLPVARVDPVSGVISGSGPVPRDPGDAHCGRGRGWTALDHTQLALAIFVRPNGRGARVTVNARFAQDYALGTGTRRVLCQSSGRLEQRVFDALR